MHTLIRAQVWHCLSSPTTHKNPEDALKIIQDGALVFSNDGKIQDLGEFKTIAARYPNAQRLEFPSCVIVPGFVDAHLHLPQLNMIGRYGETLLGWLDRYTFPEEARFQSYEFAKIAAKNLIAEMISWGSVLGAFFASSSYASAQALFEACEEQSFNAIIGKVSMDRFAPKNILVKTKQDIEETTRLIKDWHYAKPFLRYALTPRFAPSCTPGSMRGLAKLKEKHSGLYTQTHLAETKDEVAWVKKLFPKASSYTDVYEGFGLLDDRTILAHGIHLKRSEVSLLKKRKAILCHCPSSNLFLGSGLMAFSNYQAEGLRLSLGSDIAGGTSLSLWHGMDQAYKVASMRGERVHPVSLFHATTLGGAESLGFAETLGNFEVGRDATFQVLRPKGLLLDTMTRLDVSPTQKMLGMITQMERSLIEQVWIKGKRADLRA